jgi:CRISPR-associated protein Csd2
MRRHDFVLLFDVTDGNPNGDPDAGNLPRVDPETMQGLVTDVSLKRRVRNWIDATRGDQSPYRIYVQNKGVALNTMHQEAYDAEKLKSSGSRQTRGDVDKARAWMCEQFYDIRTFGAVMTTGVNCGQVRGPVQMTFARSIDPLIPLEVAITRVAITKPEDAVKAPIEGEEDGRATGKVTEMGRKSIVPYGLYRGYGFVTPTFARHTNFSVGDLSLFWAALQNMWDLDRSSSRGLTACRGVYVFSHESELGNAPADQLLSRIQVKRRAGVQAPRSVSDYEVSVDEAEMPQGVTLTKLAG